MFSFFVRKMFFILFSQLETFFDQLSIDFPKSQNTYFLVQIIIQLQLHFQLNIRPIDRVNFHLISCSNFRDGYDNEQKYCKIVTHKDFLETRSPRMASADLTAEEEKVLQSF